PAERRSAAWSWPAPALLAGRAGPARKRGLPGRQDGGAGLLAGAVGTLAAAPRTTCPASAAGFDGVSADGPAGRGATEHRRGARGRAPAAGRGGWRAVAGILGAGWPRRAGLVVSRRCAARRAGRGRAAAPGLRWAGPLPAQRAGRERSDRPAGVRAAALVSRAGSSRRRRRSGPDRRCAPG